MFGISGFELLIILVVVLIIFGPDKLPELGRTIGRAMGTFKRAQQDMERIIRAEMYVSDSKPSAEDSSQKPTEESRPEPATKAASIYAATDETDEEDEE